MHGYVVIGGYRFPLDGPPELRSGAVHIHYTIRGPHPEVNGHITVFGADGIGVWQGGHKIYPELGHAGMWSVDYELRVSAVDTWHTVHDIRA